MIFLFTQLYTQIGINLLLQWLPTALAYMISLVAYCSIMKQGDYNIEIRIVMCVFSIIIYGLGIRGNEIINRTFLKT